MTLNFIPNFLSMSFLLSDPDAKIIVFMRLIISSFFLQNIFFCIYNGIVGICLPLKDVEIKRNYFKLSLLAIVSFAVFFIFRQQFAGVTQSPNSSESKKDVLAASPDDSVPGLLTLISTFKSIGVYGSFTGDANGNVSAKVEYKKAGDAVWIAGHAPIIDQAYKEARGSVVGLTPNTDYEIRVTFSDPESGTSELLGTMTTKNDIFSLGSGSTYYVSPLGSDTNPGTLISPFRTIQKAANTVTLGGTVRVLAGTYNEEVSITVSGT